jgi:hypothetical protein
MKATRQAAVLPAKPTERFMAASQILSMYLLLRYWTSLCVCLCPCILPKFLSQSHFKTGGLLPIISYWRQAPWDSRPVIFFQLNACDYSPYATSSLMTGWVCRLQMLLALASSVILGSESRGTRDHILLSQIRGSPNLEGQVPVFTSPRNWVPFSLPPTTRRTTVEVFEPVSTWGQIPESWISGAITSGQTAGKSSPPILSLSLLGNGSVRMQQKNCCPRRFLCGPWRIKRK